jgi:ParB-like chromosome segregation protein Spo0J
MKLKDIKPNPNNPRVLRDDKFQKLKQSITEFPKMLSLRPMVIDENNVVLGGNMRLRALQELGFNDIDEAWVKRSSDLTEEEKKRFIIADNVAFGEWDWDTLANDWEVVDLEAWGLDIPQFDTVEEEEVEDLSDKIKSMFKIEVICKDEQEQEKTYNKLIEQNYECRLLTL